MRHYPRFQIEMRLLGIYATIGSRPWDSHGLIYWRRSSDLMGKSWPRRYYRIGPVFWSRDVKVTGGASAQKIEG